MTSNLCGYPTGLTNMCTVFIVRSVHNFREKNSYTLILVQPHPSLSSTRCVHNLRKSHLYNYLDSRTFCIAFIQVYTPQLYTYKVCKSSLPFPRVVILPKILGKNSHTLTKAGVTYCDSTHNSREKLAIYLLNLPQQAFPYCDS